MGEENKQKIQTFRDLKTWQEGHRLVIKIYKITKNFPKTEIFGITNQIQRAAVSITSNLAEGFSRNSSKEKHQFYATSLGSLTELENQVIISRDLSYISNLEYNELTSQIILINKLMHGLMRTVSNHYT